MPRLLISASGEEDQVPIRVTRDEREAAPGFFAEGLVKDDARGLELEVERVIRLVVMMYVRYPRADVARAASRVGSRSPGQDRQATEMSCYPVA